MWRGLIPAHNTSFQGGIVMKKSKVLNKDNMIVSELIKEFIDIKLLLGKPYENLIKFPNSKYNTFFRCTYDIEYEDEIEFISEDPITGSDFDGLKALYRISPNSDENMSIEVYDNNKNLIRKITIKDLYNHHSHFVPDLENEFDDINMALITAYDHDQIIKFVCKIEFNWLALETFPLCANIPVGELIDYYTYLLADKIIDKDISIVLLKDKEALAWGFDEVKSELNWF